MNEYSMNFMDGELKHRKVDLSQWLNQDSYLVPLIPSPLALPWTDGVASHDS